MTVRDDHAGHDRIKHTCNIIILITAPGVQVKPLQGERSREFEVTGKKGEEEEIKGGCWPAKLTQC